jgi:5-methylcytosine-specific restriction endonuclease McrA
MEDLICEKCESDNLHFVRYPMSNGVEMLRKQCYSCGYLLTYNYKRTLVPDFKSVSLYSPERRNDYKIRAIEKGNINKIFANYRADHFQRSLNYYHNVYLLSAEWKHKRNLIMSFYNHTCQDCGDKATDVHHITYDNIFKEKFEDLTPLCRSCHNKKHYATT